MVVQDKLAADLSLEECTYIQCGNDLLQEIQTRRRTGYGIAVITNIGEHINGILQGNGIKINITKAMIVA